MSYTTDMDNSLEKLWNNILEDLLPTVSKGNFNTVLKPTLLLSFEDDIATIAAGSPIIVNLLQKRFLDRIKEAFKIQTGKDVDILFVVKNLPSKAKKTDSFSPLFETATTDKKPMQAL